MDIRVRQREKSIIEYIGEHESVTVAELSERFGVSEITIRRDLDRLCEKKVITRCHGGAKLRANTNVETSETEFEKKSTQMLDEKKRLGRRACDFVKDYDIVFMNSGSTVLQFLMQLERRDVTVITNNAAAPACPIHAGTELLMLGGIYNSRTRSMGGEITTNSLTGIYSTCTILGVNSLDVNEGMTTNVYQECAVNNAMISHTKGNIILLADSTKMGKISSYVSSPLSKINVIITDDHCPDSFINEFRKQGIEVIVV